LQASAKGVTEGDTGRVPDPIVVGSFDSGVGGLSVLRTVRAQLPHLDLIYAADSRHAPYGTKPPDFVRARSLTIARYLVESGHASAIVVACNTATTHAVNHLRGMLPDVPFVGMEPGIKPAAGITRTGTVGVLATGSTLSSARFANLVERTAEGVNVLTQPCPGLVEQVESGDLDGPRTRALIQQYVEPLLARGVDTIVLGCTHYPLLRSAIEEIAGPGITIIDTAEAVARQTARVLEARFGEIPMAAAGARGRVTFVSSAEDLDASRTILERLWGEPADCFSRLPV
jgi:glutamate racemase